MNQNQTKPTKVSLSLGNWLTIIAIVISQGLTTIGFIMSRELKLSNLEFRIQVNENQVVQSVLGLKDHVDTRLNHQQQEIGEMKKMLALLVEREMNRPRNVLAKE